MLKWSLGNLMLRQLELEDEAEETQGMAPGWGVSQKPNAVLWISTKFSVTAEKARNTALKVA